MKGFANSTKMQSGHNFTRTSVSVPSHQRAMPAKRAAPSSDAPTLDSAPAPSGALAKGLSPTGYPPRMARMTMKQTGKMGVRPPRTSQVEPTDGNENGFAKGGRVKAPLKMADGGDVDGGDSGGDATKGPLSASDRATWNADTESMRNYKAGYNDGVRAPAAQRAVNGAGAPPTKGASPAMTAYKQGYYEGSKASSGQQRTQMLNKARGGGVKVAARTPMIPPKSGC